MAQTHILSCQKLKVPRSPGVFPLLLIQMVRKYSKIPQKSTFRGPPKPMFIYLVDRLVRENRSWQISKIWLPKVFQWVLMFINPLFTFLGTCRINKINLFPLKLYCFRVPKKRYFRVIYTVRLCFYEGYFSHWRSLGM